MNVIKIEKTKIDGKTVKYDVYEDGTRLYDSFGDGKFAGRLTSTPASKWIDAKSEYKEGQVYAVEFSARGMALKKEFASYAAAKSVFTHKRSEVEKFLKEL